jgi:endogenous inhibitor of DNA gyrase (YacG/DUF329 family)
MVHCPNCFTEIKHIKIKTRTYKDLFGKTKLVKTTIYTCPKCNLTVEKEDQHSLEPIPRWKA